MTSLCHTPFAIGAILSLTFPSAPLYLFVVSHLLALHFSSIMRLMKLFRPVLMVYLILTPCSVHHHTNFLPDTTGQEFLTDITNTGLAFDLMTFKRVVVLLFLLSNLAFAPSNCILLILFGSFFLVALSSSGTRQQSFLWLTWSDYRTQWAPQTYRIMDWFKPTSSRAEYHICWSWPMRSSWRLPCSTQYLSFFRLPLGILPFRFRQRAYADNS